MQLTVKDVAGLLNISEKTVYRWIDERKLPGYRLSGQYRFNRAELLEWVAGKPSRVGPHAAVADAAISAEKPRP